MADGKIQVSSKIFVFLVILLVGCFMIIAFLLGRESGRDSASLPAQPPPSQTLDAGSSLPESPPPSLRPLEPSPGMAVSSPEIGFPSPDASSAETTPPPLAFSSPAQTPAKPAVSSSEKAHVEKYFQQYEAIGASVKYWDDPNNLAQECIRATLAGDTTGIDRLIEAYRGFQYGVARLTAPKSCKEHQNKTIETLGYSIQILENMKRCVTSGDVESLTGLQTQAEAAKQKGAEVDLLEKQIKAKYGIQ